MTPTDRAAGRSWRATLMRTWRWLTYIDTTDPLRQVLNRAFAAVSICLFCLSATLALTFLLSQESLAATIIGFASAPAWMLIWWLNRRGTTYGAMLSTFWMVIGTTLGSSPSSLANPEAPIPLILVFSVAIATLFIRPRAGWWALLLQMGAIGLFLLASDVPREHIWRFLTIGTLNLAGFTVLVVFGATIFTQALRSSIAANAALTQLNAGLEQRVAARTADLAAANQSLRARFERLVELMPNGVLIVDTAGQISLANPAALQMFGARLREHMLGASLTRRIAPERLDQYNAHVQQAIEAGESALPFETTCLRLDDTPFPAEIDIGAFDWDGERLACVIVRDVTRRHQLEAQLLQAQKMESVGRLAGGLAHDFNNLLTAIMGYSSLAMEGLPKNSALHSDLAEIDKAAHSAAELTRQLLAFARRQAIDPRVFNPNQLLGDVEKLLRRLLGERIRLVLLPAPDLGLTLADPVQIEQVLVNLAVNARDAMPEGGEITIQTSNVMLDASYAEEHVGAVAGAYVMLAVSDTGMGIDEETRQLIFEPFFTTKAPGRGTGLGLATCYGIVQQHGGIIEVASEPGRGTTFTIYLPRAEGRAEAPARRSPEVAAAPRGGETILLVEDAGGARAASARILADLGYTVLEAADGEEALELARSRGGAPPDLLLTDAILPKLSGQQLARDLAALFPGIRILFTSGYTERNMPEPGSVQRGAAFLAKPFTAATLARKVRAVLDER